MAKETESPAAAKGTVRLPCGCLLYDEGISISITAVCHAHINRIRQAVTMYHLGLLKV